MVRMSWMIGAFAASLAIAAAPRTASAQGLKWNVGAAFAAGSGCQSAPPANTFFIAFGNQVSVVFTSLGVRLPAFPGDTSLTDLKNCQVVIPSLLQQGWYIGGVTQRLTYGVLKSDQSSATITAVTDFFGLGMASLSVNVPEGMMYTPSATATKTTNLGVLNGCAGALQGLYKANVAIGAQREDMNEFLAVGAGPEETPGLDMKIDNIVAVFHCPFP